MSAEKHRDTAHALARDLNALFTRALKSTAPTASARVQSYDRKFRAVLRTYALPEDSERDDVREVGGGWFVQFDNPARRWKAIFSPTGLATVRPTIRFENGKPVEDSSLASKTVDAREPVRGVSTAHIGDDGEGGVLLYTPHTFLVFLETELDARRAHSVLADKAAMSSTTFHPTDVSTYGDRGVSIAHPAPDNVEGRLVMAAYVVAILRALAVEIDSEAAGVLVYRGSLAPARDPDDAFSVEELADTAATFEVRLNPFDLP